MEPNRPMLRKQGRAVADTFGVISADFNRDGIADLAVITPGAELLILLGLDSGLYRGPFGAEFTAEHRACIRKI